MKHIKYLFLVLSMIFIFEVINPNQSEAACSITSDVVKKLQLALMILLMKDVTQNLIFMK